MKIFLLGLFLVGNIQAQSFVIKDDQEAALKEDLASFIYQRLDKNTASRYQKVLPHPKLNHGQEFIYDIKRLDHSFSIKSFIDNSFLEFDGKKKVHEIGNMSSEETWKLLTSNEKADMVTKEDFCWAFQEEYEGYLINPDTKVCKERVLKMIDLLKTKYNAKIELVKLKHEAIQDGTETLTYIFIRFDIEGDGTNKGILILHMARSAAS